jgi:hypothetical protein
MIKDTLNLLLIFIAYEVITNLFFLTFVTLILDTVKFFVWMCETNYHLSPVILFNVIVVS